MSGGNNNDNADTNLHTSKPTRKDKQERVVFTRNMYMIFQDEPTKKESIFFTSTSIHTFIRNERTKTRCNICFPRDSNLSALCVYVFMCICTVYGNGTRKLSCTYRLNWVEISEKLKLSKGDCERNRRKSAKANCLSYDVLAIHIYGSKNGPSSSRINE